MLDGPVGVLAWRLGSGPPFAVNLGVRPLRVNLRAGSCSRRIPRERAKRWTRNWAAGAGSSLRQAGPRRHHRLQPGQTPKSAPTLSPEASSVVHAGHLHRGGRSVLALCQGGPRVRPRMLAQAMFGGAKSGYELEVAAQHNADQPPGDGERA